MNLLLFESDEIDEGGVLKVSGRRAEHILTVLKLTPGGQLRVGELNGGVALAQVSSLLPDGRVELRIASSGVAAGGQSENEVGGSKFKLRLLVALPRPQILKKVLLTSAMFGASEIIFCGCARVEKSYWSSKSLRPEAIKEQLMLGMEQGEVTFIPEVRLESRFEVCIEDVRSSSNLPLLYADRGGEDLIGLCGQSRLDGAVLALGPEGGWVDAERMALERAGFLKLGLGGYNLRVEVALAAALGQIELLRARQISRQNYQAELPD
jgi:16S rRNA (uracil1498-N3)-methyltransferase